MGASLSNSLAWRLQKPKILRSLKQNGLSWRRGRHRTAGYKLDLEVLIDLYTCQNDSVYMMAMVRHLHNEHRVKAVKLSKVAAVGESRGAGILRNT